MNPEKPMRGAPRKRGARSRRSRPRRGKRPRKERASQRPKPARRRQRIRPMLTSSKPIASEAPQGRANATTTRRTPRCESIPGLRTGRNLRRAKEAQGRHRHETRSDRPMRNEASRSWENSRTQLSQERKTWREVSDTQVEFAEVAASDRSPEGPETPGRRAILRTSRGVRGRSDSAS